MERVLVAAVPSGLLHLTIIYLQQMDMASPLASLCVNFGLGRIRSSISEKATRPLHSPFTNLEVSAACFKAAVKQSCRVP